MAKVYIMKYALTRGIIEAEVKKFTDGCVTVRHSNASNGRVTLKQSEVCMSLADAKADFERLKKKRLAHLKKQLAKLEGFEPKLLEWVPSKPKGKSK